MSVNVGRIEGLNLRLHCEGRSSVRTKSPLLMLVQRSLDIERVRVAVLVLVGGWVLE